MGVVYEKNHLCPECGVSFVKAYDLKVHLLKHLGKQYYSNYQLLQFFADDTEFLHPIQLCSMFQSIPIGKKSQNTYVGAQ